MASTSVSAVEFCCQLRGENKGLQREANKLRQEMQVLTAEITLYQQQLPDGGATNMPTKMDVSDTSTADTTTSVESMFEDYLRARTLANWKFWIFGQIIRPLFQKFNRVVVTSTRDEFCSSVISWLQSHLSLVALRPVLLNTLRFLSKHTSIMTQPEKVPEEAIQSAIESTLQDSHNCCHNHQGNQPGDKSS